MIHTNYYYYFFFIQLGKTKVFLRAGQIAILDARRAEVLDNAAKIIQGHVRTFIAHKHFIFMRKSAVNMQAFCRGTYNFNNLYSIFYVRQKKYPNVSNTVGK